MTPSLEIGSQFLVRNLLDLTHAQMEVIPKDSD